MEKQYKAVFFDLGGTLRIALKDEPHMRVARRKMAELAGTDLPYEAFFQLVEERYEPYRKWALEENREANDEELWCKWLLPDYDRKHIMAVRYELSYQYRQTKGRRVLVDGGMEVIEGLHQRGYKLGIISNLIGEHEIPDWLSESGLDTYFDTVVLSPVCGLRKPRPEIYQLACEEIGAAPSECVSVADNVKRDLAGSIQAGMGANIMFDSPERKHPLEFTEELRPDYVIKDFREILDLPILQ